MRVHVDTMIALLAGSLLISILGVSCVRQEREKANQIYQPTELSKILSEHRDELFRVFEGLGWKNGSELESLTFMLGENKETLFVVDSNGICRTAIDLKHFSIVEDHVEKLDIREQPYYFELQYLTRSFWGWYIMELVATGKK